jgi:hypothetical protein
MPAVHQTPRRSRSEPTDWPISVRADLFHGHVRQSEIMSRRKQTTRQIPSRSHQSGSLGPEPQIPFRSLRSAADGAAAPVLCHSSTALGLLISGESSLATTLQRVSPLTAKLPTSAPLSAEKTRLTLNCALSAHLENSMGTSTSAWPPGGILFSSIGNGRSAFG